MGDLLDHQPPVRCVFHVPAMLRAVLAFCCFSTWVRKRLHPGHLSEQRAPLYPRATVLTVMLLSLAHLLNATSVQYFMLIKAGWNEAIGETVWPWQPRPRPLCCHGEDSCPEDRPSVVSGELCSPRRGHTPLHRASWMTSSLCSRSRFFLQDQSRSGAAVWPHLGQVWPWVHCCRGLLLAGRKGRGAVTAMRFEKGRSEPCATSSMV